jgi:hypothetical protein
MDGSSPDSEILISGAQNAREMGHLDYWAAFTSFQISVYFARRGTFCQK